MGQCPSQLLLSLSPPPVPPISLHSAHELMHACMHLYHTLVVLLLFSFHIRLSSSEFHCYGEWDCSWYCDAPVGCELIDDRVYVRVFVFICTFVSFPNPVN